MVTHLARQPGCRELLTQTQVMKYSTAASQTQLLAAVRWLLGLSPCARDRLTKIAVDLGAGCFVSVCEPMCSCSRLHPLVRLAEDREMISKKLLSSIASWSPQEEHIKGSPPLSEFLMGAVTAAMLSNPGVPHPLHPEKQHVPVGWTSYGVPWWLCRVPRRVPQAGPQTTAGSQYCSWDCKVTANGTSSCRGKQAWGSSPSSAPVSPSTTIFCEDTTNMAFSSFGG